MRKLAILALPLLALASCGQKQSLNLTAPPSIAAAVGLAKTDYPTLKAAALIYAASPTANKNTVTAINQAIATADPLVGSLNDSSSSAAVLSVMQALSTLVLTPAGQSDAISANTKADIGNALSALSTAAQIAVTVAPLI